MEGMEKERVSKEGSGKMSQAGDTEKDKRNLKKLYDSEDDYKKLRDDFCAANDELYLSRKVPPYTFVVLTMIMVQTLLSRQHGVLDTDLLRSSYLDQYMNRIANIE